MKSQLSFVECCHRISKKILMVTIVTGGIKVNLAILINAVVSESCTKMVQ